MTQLRNPRRSYTSKLVLIVVLTGLASLLQVTIWTLERRIEQKKVQLSKSKPSKSANKEESSSQQHKEQKQQTIKPSQPTNFLHHRKQAADTGSSPVTAAEAYWNQAVTFLRDWDPTHITRKTTRKVAEYQQTDTWNATHALRALQQAAELGHPVAQHWMAQAHASGIWPIPSSESQLQLQVQDTFIIESNNNKNQQQSKAWLYWHMAALAGHVESSMALAARMTESSSSCQARLPYYQAAAHGIMDALESSPKSRAKVAPPMDKHVLYQIHLHGGTGSKLDQANKPDESEAALQFYHVRAMDASKDGGSDGQSPQAAFTLANLYHYGLRGVVQNLTLALQYYELAAHFGHWEAAGQAGKFYLWGMGMEQPDPYKAHRLFNIGMPFGLEGCRKKHQEKLRQGKDSSESIYVCDHACLNGMGILRLLGLPLVVSIDQETAEKLFKLAKEQGNMDACYNLAMMKLGWKTHYKTLEHVEGEGQTLMNEQYFPVSGSNAYKNSPTQAEYQSILTDLTTAAAKGHLQAKHRLAMMYADGVKIPWIDGQLQVVPQDCDRALKHYKWIIDNASPERSLRLRKAYKQYIAGETSKSLRNYLAAAETGSDLAQLNAAFLLERGECLDLSRIDCAKASVRLWKEAASKGHGEASLRVGDFYYYGRFRENHAGVVEPFGWFQYILYPERYLPKLWSAFCKKIYKKLFNIKESEEMSVSTTNEGQVCAEGSQEGACSSNLEKEPPSDEEHSLENDLKMAAHYYRMAADKSSSPRAQFNLGFMYEWGQGLKQDFPLAKRHYDLAVAGLYREGEIPVSISLFYMDVHEYLVKRFHEYQDWWAARKSKTSVSVPGAGEGNKAGRPLPSPQRAEKTKMDVFISHLLTWESLLILLLTIVLSFLLRHRRTRR